MDGAMIPKIHRARHQRLRFAGQILHDGSDFVIVEGFGGGQSGYLIPKKESTGFTLTKNGYQANELKLKQKERI